jgi:hypothetical protein
LEGSRQSKVSNLQDPVLDKNILRFQVSVHDTRGVATIDPFEQLAGERLWKLEMNDEATDLKKIKGEVLSLRQ